MPLAESMISVVKSNKSIMLDKSRRFRKTLVGYGNLDKNDFDFPEITPEILVQIREKLKKERRQLLWKRGVLFSIVIVVVILILIYF